MSNPKEKTKLYENPDFTELVIAHLVRDPALWRQGKRFKITAEDFKEHPVYFQFIKITEETNGFQSSSLFDLKFQQVLDSGEIPSNLYEVALDFYDYCFSLELSTSYVESELQEYLKYRRFVKLKTNHIGDSAALLEAVSQLAFDFSTNKANAEVSSLSPFEELSESEAVHAIPTGFDEIDAALFGLGRGEFGFLLGHSGSGKTSMGVNIGMHVVKQGYKVLFMSLEEPAVNVANRFYANQFEIDYSLLHRGKAGFEKEQKFRDLDADTRAVLSNLRIDDLRDLAPVSANTLFEYIVKKAKDTGFIPDLVIIDQMDYLVPNETNAKDEKWNKYEAIAFDMDKFADKAIETPEGPHKFAVWLMHQIKGKIKRYYTYDDIAGFKGVVKPSDLALGLGKESPDATEVSIFSLKSRHAANVNFEYLADLKYMRFLPLEQKAKEETSLPKPKQSFKMDRFKPNGQV